MLFGRANAARAGASRLRELGAVGALLLTLRAPQRCESSSFAARGRVVAAAHDESGSRCVTADERHELHVLERDGDAWRSFTSWRVRAACAALPRVSSARACARAAMSTHATHGAQAHDAPLRGVALASPVFGSLLASCSDDGTVRVWSVQSAGQAKPVATLGVAERAVPVVCVAFAPQHHGLLIAAAGADGVVRLYECADRTGASWDEQVRLCACCAEDCR